MATHEEPPYIDLPKTNPAETGEEPAGFSTLGKAQHAKLAHKPGDYLNVPKILRCNCHQP
jgi:hypothetical protein